MHKSQSMNPKDAYRQAPSLIRNLLNYPKRTSQEAREKILEPQPKEAAHNQKTAPLL